MATIRNRSRFNPGTLGNFKIGSTTYGTAWNPKSLEESCQDVIEDYGNPHIFDHSKLTRKGARVNGKGKWIGYTVSATDWPAPTTSLPNALNGDSVNTMFSWLLARSNPSRTEINLPVSLIELRELPSMIRQAGRVLRTLKGFPQKGLKPITFDSVTGSLAATNLAISFGWAPIVNDLASLVLLTESVEKRKKEMNRYHSGRGLKRKLKLGNYEQKSTETGTYFSNPFMGNYSGSREKVSTVRQWGTIVWKPNSSLPLVPRPDDFQIWKDLTGFTIEAIAENVWEALPWSWLVDYFTNLGDLVAVTNNRLNASYANACIMQEKIRTVRGSSGPTTTGMSYEGQHDVLVHHIRTPVTGVPYPEANFPLLSGKQLSILGSLAILRFI